MSLTQRNRPLVSLPFGRTTNGKRIIASHPISVTQLRFLLGILLGWGLANPAYSDTAYGETADIETAGGNAADQPKIETSAPPGLPISKHQIMKLTDEGIFPPVIKMRKEDSIVFFLNSSSDALATVAVEFNEHTTHCASTNLTIGEHGVIASSKPMPPREFSSVCFHDSGTYPVTAFGLKKNPAGVKATIEVE